MDEMRNEMLESKENQVPDITLNEESKNIASEEILDNEVQQPQAAEAADDDAPVGSADPAEGKAALLEALKALLERPVDETREEVAQIKSTFYAIRNEEIAQEKEEFLQRGNEESAFASKTDELEEQFKAVLEQIKELRAQHVAEVAAQQMKNLEAKQNIITEIQAITNDPDNINKQYARVQQLQQDFKAVGEVPAEAQTGIWKDYTKTIEQFYDLLKMNKELRDYDFKKNLEAKQALIAEAEALSATEDVIEAFKALQGIHEKWREIGPVAKELRDEIWGQFKAASADVNKRYQAFFEAKKERERANEVAKTELCQRLEELTQSAELKTYAAWEQTTATIIALQEEWKKLGFAQRRTNNELFARFRKSCDDFFDRKANFFKQMKEDQASNLEKKLALCEKAEQLKESTDWKNTTEVLTELQKEWKAIGPVAKKHSDVIWKRFIGACDEFFERKAKLHVNVRQQEHANLKLKKSIVAQIKEFTANTENEDAPKQIRELMKQWQEVGHVPFKEKDKLYQEYREAVNEAYAKLNMKEAKASLANFSSSISKLSDTDKIGREREKLVRAYEQKKNELKTFENNLGFFNARSKSGNSMLKEMERKIQRIKDDIELLEQKIRIIDSKA